MIKIMIPKKFSKKILVLMSNPGVITRPWKHAPVSSQNYLIPGAGSPKAKICLIPRKHGSLGAEINFNLGRLRENFGQFEDVLPGAPIKNEGG